MIPAMLTDRDSLPEPHDGVWQMGWVTKAEVEEPTYEEGDGYWIMDNGQWKMDNVKWIMKEI